jgi:hypothetical protein
MFRVQAPELFDDQKQEDADGETGTQEVLPVLPQAYGP